MWYHTCDLHEFFCKILSFKNVSTVKYCRTKKKLIKIFLNYKVYKKTNVNSYAAIHLVNNE